MVVEEWAGSTPIFCKNSGKTAPKQILLKTIVMRLHVIAIVSANGVRKTAALKNPAKLKIPLSETAILTSRPKN